MQPSPGGLGGHVMQIEHDPIPSGGAVLRRHAVRAVIRERTELLMVHSRVAGDYKFPGGGVEAGEDALAALAREVSEECGRAVTHIGAPLLNVIEYRSAREPGLVFQMHSTYHPCEVGGPPHAQRLDGYEEDLGFIAAWVHLDEAIATNQRILDTGEAQTWVERETRVLRWLRTRWADR